MYIALSPTYSIRNEANASFLIRVNKIIDEKSGDFNAFNIPPFIGYVLAHIGDSEYPVSVNAISEALKVSSASIDNFVRQIVDNQENKEFKFSDTQTVVFPSGLLKEYAQKPCPSVYEEPSFNRYGTLTVKRPSVPFNVNFMVTTNCSTDCIYCYANRNLHPHLGTARILDLIKELKEQGTINVTLTGGDIFAHPDWRILLKCVRDNGYKPFLSTKTPLNFEQVRYLRELGYDEIQFSLDSVDPEQLKRLIRVKDGYLEKVTSFFNCCSELKLNVLVRSVLTKINASKENLTALYTYLAGFDCIKEWVMIPAFFSKYKEEYYKSLEVDNEDLKWIYEFTKGENLTFTIGLSKITNDGYVLKKFNTLEEYVCYNQICLANTTSMSILANGDCSVCEMLYDSPEYIIGNVNESSLKDIWNSDKALGLYTMAQRQFPETSPCRKCGVFEKCRNGFGKRVCYSDIAKTGKSKWDPDPRCPQAEDIDLIL